MNTTPAPQPAPQARPAAWLRALLVAVLVTALAASGGLANAGIASADTGASFEGCPQLDEGDTGPCVAQLQQKLTKVHPEYNLPGTETFGPATRIALLDFQGRNHLGADGRFGTTTARELDRQYDAANVGGGAVASPQPKPVETTPDAGSSLPGCPQLDLGDTGPCVAQLQQLLNKVHPEYKLPGSQTYGPQTQAAVRDFQERNHITGGTGQFGPGTAAALQNQAADTSKVSPPVSDPVNPNQECLDQGKVRDPKSGNCVSDGTKKKTKKDGVTLGAITQNCGIATCSLYLSRSGTKSVHDFLEKHDWQAGLLSNALCEGVSMGAGKAGAVVGSSCGAQSVWITEEIQRAAEDHGSKGACLKVTYTNTQPAVVTYWSTNNGKFCKD